MAGVVIWFGIMCGAIGADCAGSPSIAWTTIAIGVVWIVGWGVGVMDAQGWRDSRTTASPAAPREAPPPSGSTQTSRVDR